MATPKQHEQYVKEVGCINPNIEVVDRYVNAQTKILHKCKIDGCEWMAIPNNILRGKGCPKCGSLKRSNIRTKKREEFVLELLNNNPNILLVGEYMGSREYSHFQCKICGHNWQAQSSSVLCGSGCPKCRASRGEMEIDKVLHRLNIDHVHQYKFTDCIDKAPLPFDFYLPSYHVCIEYDGRQHFEPVGVFGGDEGFAKLQLHDEIKNNYCLSHDLMLLRIGYWNDTPEQIEMAINMLMGIFNNKVIKESAYED